MEERKKEEEEMAAHGVEEKEDSGGGGFISHLISNLIHETRSSGEETGEETEHHRVVREASMEDEFKHVGKDEKGGEGLIGHFIANLVSPMSPRSGGHKKASLEEEAELGEQDRNRNGGESYEAEGDSGNSGGVIGNIISSILHHNHHHHRPNGDSTEMEKKSEAAGGEEEEEGGGGGGIIENIVSHFPPSLPEDAAPTTDEASILIHSVRD